MATPLAMTSNLAQGVQAGQNIQANQINLQNARMAQLAHMQQAQAAQQEQARMQGALQGAAAQQPGAQGQPQGQVPAAIQQATQAQRMAETYDSAAQRLSQQGDVTGAMRATQMASEIRQKEAGAALAQAKSVKMLAQAKTAQLDQQGQLLAGVHDQSSWQAWQQQYQQTMGAPAPHAGEPYSPKLVDSLKLIGANVKDQLAQVHTKFTEAAKQIELAQQQQRVDLAKQQFSLLEGKDARAAKDAKVKLKMEQEKLTEMGRHNKAMEQVGMIRAEKSGERSKVALGKSVTSQDIKTATAVLGSSDVFSGLDTDSQNHVAAVVAAYAKKLQGEGVPQYDALQQAATKADQVLKEPGMAGRDLTHWTSKTLQKHFKLDTGTPAQAAPAQPGAAQASGYVYQGHTYPASEVEQQAKSLGMSVDEYVKKYDLQPAGE